MILFFFLYTWHLYYVASTLLSLVGDLFQHTQFIL